MSSIFSKKRTKTSLIVVKLNSFVCFLEGTLAWKNHFHLVWPLDRTIKGWMVNDAILECIMNDTLGSGINVRVRLLIEGKKLKNDCNALDWCENDLKVPEHLGHSLGHLAIIWSEKPKYFLANLYESTCTILMAISLFYTIFGHKFTRADFLPWILLSSQEDESRKPILPRKPNFWCKYFFTFIVLATQ